MESASGGSVALNVHKTMTFSHKIWVWFFYRKKISCLVDIFPSPTYSLFNLIVTIFAWICVKQKDTSFSDLSISEIHRKCNENLHLCVLNLYSYVRMKKPVVNYGWSSSDRSVISSYAFRARETTEKHFWGNTPRSELIPGSRTAQPLFSFSS